MVDPTKQRGDAGRPIGPEPKRKEEIDPEKFKKVLKVEGADEAEKKRKRQLKKGVEEGDGEEVVEEIPLPSPATSFSEFMDDGTKLDSLYDAESAGVRRQAAPESSKQAPTPGSISTEGTELGEEPPSPPQTAPSPYEPQPPAPRAAPPEEEPPSYEEIPLELPSLPEEEAPPPQPQAQEPPPPQAAPPQKKEKDTSLLASQPKKDALKTKKKTPAKAKPRVEIVKKEGPVKPKEAPLKAKKSVKHAPKAPEKKELAPPPPPTRKKVTPQMTFTRFEPTQIRDKKIGKKAPIHAAEKAPEGTAIPAPTKGEMDMMGEGRKDKKDDFPFINADALIAALPLSENPIPPVIPPGDVPAYSKLSPEAYELFAKMAGTILIQQYSGITTTTITLNMEDPESIFNGAQVIFDHYSTAPNSYNLQLVGSAQAVNAFNANMADLVAAFKQSKNAFEVNILSPSLTGKKPLIRRKKGAGGGGGKSKR